MADGVGAAEAGIGERGTCAQDRDLVDSIRQFRRPGRRQKPDCWDASLATPGPVAIVETGTWDGKPIGLVGGNSPVGNHAKIGVSDGGGAELSIFGDLNQQGTLVPVTPKKTKANPHPKPTCDSSQNGRGGTFYVLDDRNCSTV